MNRRICAWAVVAGTIWAVGMAWASGTSAAEPLLLKIDVAIQQRLGIVTQPLVAAHRTGSVTGFARTLDAVPLATLESDLAAANAALAASQAEADRLRVLNAADQAVSKQSVEAALAQARGDAAKVLLLKRRLGLEWGPAIATMNNARRNQLVADLAAGRAALVRIDAATGLAGQRGLVSLDLGAAGTAHAAILGAARAGDPRLQTTGLLALVSGPLAVNFGANTVAPATIAAGKAADGVILPRASLLRTGGQTFVFIRKDAGSFERRAVETPVSDPQGLFAPSGFHAGEQVVVSGASQLFAAQAPAPKGD